MGFVIVFFGICWGICFVLIRLFDLYIYDMKDVDDC